MSEHSHRIVALDMLTAMEKAMAFTENITKEQFMADERTRDAVYLNLIVLGEAASRMPEHIIQRHGDIPWQKMVSTRNALVHGYDKIDDSIVWNIVRGILPSLIEQVKKIA